MVRTGGERQAVRLRTGIGSPGQDFECFSGRHLGLANVACLDGHVGSLRTRLRLAHGGLDLRLGMDWNAGNTASAFWPITYQYYLFAPSGPALEGPTLRVIAGYTNLDMN